MSRAETQMAPVVGEGLGEPDGEVLGLREGLGLCDGLALCEGLGLVEWLVLCDGLGLVEGLALCDGLGLCEGLGLWDGFALCDGLVLCEVLAPVSLTARTAATTPTPQGDRGLVACAAKAGAIVRLEKMKNPAATWAVTRPARMIPTGTSSLRC